MSSPNRYANGHARREVRAWLKSQQLPCHICGRAIDYSLPAGHPMSFEVDEVVPVSKGGSPIDRSNVAPAHRICNERRGNRPVRRQINGCRDWPPAIVGHGSEPAVADVRVSDINAAIADALGPRPCDLGTEDARWF